MQSWLSSLYIHYQVTKTPSQLGDIVQNIRKNPASSYYRGHHTLTAILLASTLSLIGCDNASKPTDKQQTVSIEDNEIILSKDVIWSTQPERYQPSFNLYGVLVPIAQATILAPDSGNITSILVEDGDWVKPQQILLRLSATVTHPNDAINETATNTTATNTANNNQQVTITGYNDRVPTSIGERNIANTTTLNSNHTLTDDISDTTETLEEDLDTLVENLDTLENNSTQTNKTKTEDIISKQQTNEFVIKAPFAGKISELISSHTVEKQQVLMKISDTHQLQLIGELPISTQSQLSIGQNVNFTIPSTHDTFTGQISKITPNLEQQIVTVHAPVMPNRISQSHLKSGMSATMTIEYGQMQVGVRLPAAAIHNVDLSMLTAKHPRPATPIEGHVWAIKQDQRLELQPVQIVAYFADTQQYLVSGINNDSLICVAELPLDSQGKKVALQ
ncbi:efflux RND transporter periplasmic adaptor subunit [Psychrobacter sp. I-STPA10]|uniref:efflux RND transporter periplasmic adaptor subunit n=1 Tax=Psychrobacter sp. I-STPA10 TaxID=2585769 RepID=UPI001E6541EE|nr:efflux RND transporter periplasmic adaptor subunit [Psychrobacter sp. I-STPA10]